LASRAEFLKVTQVFDPKTFLKWLKNYPWGGGFYKHTTFVLWTELTILEGWNENLC